MTTNIVAMLLLTPGDALLACCRIVYDMAVDALYMGADVAVVVVVIGIVAANVDSNGVGAAVVVVAVINSS